MPGEHDEMIYLPLGAGVIIPPWNFPLAILTGMTRGGAGGGEHDRDQAVERDADHRREVRRGAARSRIPGAQLLRCAPAAEPSIGDLLVEHPKTRFVSFTGSRDVGLRINELAAKPRKGQIWIKRVVAEMGGKDAIIVDREADLDSAVDRRGAIGVSAIRGRSARRARARLWIEAVYDEFLEKLKAKVAALRWAPPEDHCQLHGTGDQRGREEDDSRLHRGRARTKGG